MDVTAQKCDRLKGFTMQLAGSWPPREWAVLAYHLQAKGD
jgi:hypothetical protein